MACGEEPDLTPKVSPVSVKSVFIFSNDDYEEYLYLKENSPEIIIREVYVDKTLLGKASNSSNRAGCYIMKS